MANEAEPFFYRDPAGREDIFSTGGRRKMNKKGKKKGAALLLLFLSKVSHLFFFPSSECPKEKKRPTFSDLGSPCDDTVWEEERFDTYCLLFYFLPFSILSFWWKCKFWQERKERRRGCISSISLLCDIIPSAARASLSLLPKKNAHTIGQAKIFSNSSCSVPFNKE